MNADIKNPLLKSFYSIYSMNRKIVKDFYELLPEEKYDFRLVDNEKTKSDTPKESLAHLIEVQRMYINGIQNKELVFYSLNLSTYLSKTKEQLLKDFDEMENETFDLLNNKVNLGEKIKTPWGEDSILNVLYALNSHLILHTGWNLALMDVLGLERYKSLRNYWG